MTVNKNSGKLNFRCSNLYERAFTVFEDPTPAARAFVAKGGKLIPVGYGASANEAQLRAMGNNCTQMVGKLGDLINIVIPWVTSAICK